MVYLFFTGGAGTGGYFVIVYIQIILIFPLFYYVINRFKKTGFCLLILINVLFEIIIQVIVEGGMDLLSFYRLCSIRYFSAVASGIYIFMQRSLKKPFLFLSFLLGAIYIIGYAYFDWHAIAVTYWPHSSFYTSLFLFPLIVFALSWEGDKITKAGKLLAIIGKNTFYIFLVQMDYFTSRYSWHIGGLSILSMCFLSLVICTVIGIVFGSICHRFLIRT